MSRLDLVGKIIMKDGFSEPLGKLQSESVSATSALGGITSALGAIGVGFSAAAIVKGIYDLTELGAQAETVANSFNHLTAASNVNAEALLSGLRAASHGAVNDTELMITANRALLAGGEQLASKLPQLFEIARASASATGQDIGYVFETLVKGIVKASPLLIDNADIYIKIGDAVDQYAASLGKSTEELTKQEQQQAVLNGVLSQGADFIDKVGANATTNAESVESLSTAFYEMKRAFGEALIDMGTVDLIQGMADDIRDFSGLIDEVNDKISTSGKLTYIWSVYWNALREDSDSANFVNSIDSMIASFNRLRDGIFSDSGAGGGGAGGFGTIEMDVSTESAQKDVDNVKKRITDIKYMFPMNLQINFQDNLEGVANRLQRVVDRFAGDLPLEQYQAFSAQAQRTAQSLAMMRTVMGDSAEVTWYEAQAVKTLTDGLDTATNKFEAMPEAIGRTADAFSSLQSDIESVLTGGLSVSPADMLATQMGTYQDKALESARRLADIANKGTSSPWAKFFEIPPEVLAQGEGAVKLWAKSLQKDVTDLTRPDLINWDAFIADFQEMKDREAAKEMTIDIAVGKLSAAGLLSGSKEERKKQVAQMLGIEKPDMEFRPALSVTKDDVAMMAGTLQTSMDRYSDPVVEAGKRMGELMLNGINKAFGDATTSFWHELASKLLPDIVNYLAGTEALP